MITSCQIRAARGLLNWKQKTLAEKCGMSTVTVSNAELGKKLKPKSLSRIRWTLIDAGVTFLDRGVQLK
jgi:transcriptional regulator with XRE-family HTH domain